MSENSGKSGKKVKIPDDLRQGLERIESSGAMPLFIPKVLENFLTEQGVYASSMTPEDAWNALRELKTGKPQRAHLEEIEED